MAQVFSRKANLFIRLAVIATLLGIPLAYALGSAIVRSSWVTHTYRPPDQPVPFSHRHHVGGLGLDCRYCHTSVEVSAFAGIPSTDICMTCHSQLWTNAEMLEPVRRSLRTGEPLRWTRVHDLPDFVYFNHSIHIAKGVGCEECHGRVDKMALTAQAHDLHMTFCLSCHQSPESRLRPLDKVFVMGWQPPPDQLQQGRRLAREYHLNREIMVDCSTCHR